jgi:hypothetical protein
MWWWQVQVIFWLDLVKTDGVADHTTTEKLEKITSEWKVQWM